MQFTNYRKVIDYLIHQMPKTSRDVFDDESTLKKNTQIMQVLGNPQESHPAVHIAGTSGKGTVCYLIDALLRAHTKRTGLTQSPHIYDIRERIQINGQLISERLFMKTFKGVLGRMQENDIPISYFEMLSAMGFACFAHSKLDYMVIETGFGGRLDATNVMRSPRKICVLTQIGYDHMHALGNTLEKIASEKAGIIQPGNVAVVLRQDPTVNAVFEKRCREQQAEIIWVEPGETYQRTNDALATTVCRLLAKRDGWQFDEATAEATLQQVFIPGRFERRHYKDHLVILDGAHNPQKLAALAGELMRKEKSPATVVLSIGERKDLDACIKALQPATKRIIATEYFTNEKDIPIHPTPAHSIVDACRSAGVEASAHPSPAQALAAASNFAEPIVVTGSFYLLGEIDRSF